MDAPVVLFDLDGTLVDSLPGIEFSVDSCLAECNAPRRKRDLRVLIGPPIRAILQELVPGTDHSQLLLLEQSFRKFYDAEGWRKTVLHEGALETLNKLRMAGFRLFLVTNKPQLPTRQILNMFSLTDLFTDAVCRDTQTPPFQSKAEMLQYVVSAHGLDPAECLYVGDSLEDFRAAAETGIPVTLVAHGYGLLQPELAGCTVLNQLSDVLGTVGILEVI